MQTKLFPIFYYFEMCNSVLEIIGYILVTYQKLAALMVQWVATERHNCHHDDDIRRMTMTMKEV